MSDWSYVGATGPVVWHTLRPWPEWADCATSSYQSPVNLVPSLFTANRPTVSIPTIPSAILRYDGHALKVDLYNLLKGTVFFRDKTYTVQEYHFHTPSEHFVDSEYFPLEMHLVSRASDDTLLVLGILIDITSGPSTPFIASTMENIGEIPAKTGELDFSDIAHLFQASQLYQYTGSLTIPPCPPGVMWVVARERFVINLATWQSAKSIMKFNSRYIQNTPGQDNLLTIAAKPLCGQ